MSTEIIKSEQLQVGNVVLNTLRSDGHWVVIKPVCEALGLAAHGQVERLRRQGWAVTRVMRATGADGKSYEMFCLEAEQFSMWLATLDASRIKDAGIKAALLVLQREAAKALDRHFRSEPAPSDRALCGKAASLLFAMHLPNMPIGHVHSSMLKPGQMELTTNPGAFWRPGARAWVANAGTVVCDSRESCVIATGCELLREATEADLASVGVFFRGTHKFSDGTLFVSHRRDNRAEVFAFGDAKIEARGRMIVVHAYERAVISAEACFVVAKGFSQVLASGAAVVFATEMAIVEARGWANITAHDDVQVRARGQAVVRAAPSVVTHLTEQAVRLEYDKKPLQLPRCTMAAPLQLSA